MVQGLILGAPNAGGLGLIPGQGTRSHMLQLKPPHTATKDPTTATKTEDPTCPKAQHSQIKKKKTKQKMESESVTVEARKQNRNLVT